MLFASYMRFPAFFQSPFLETDLLRHLLTSHTYILLAGFRRQMSHNIAKVLQKYCKWNRQQRRHSGRRNRISLAPQPTTYHTILPFSRPTCYGFRLLVQCTSMQEGLRRYRTYCVAPVVIMNGYTKRCATISLAVRGASSR